MQTIGELLSRDLSQPIEEVIKFDQLDEKTIHVDLGYISERDRLRQDEKTEVLHQMESFYEIQLSNYWSPRF